MSSEKSFWDFCRDSKGYFTVESGQGNQLSAVATVHDKYNANTVIICHGLFSSKDNRLCQTIAKHCKVNAVRFDFHGNGESQGIKDWSFGDYKAEVIHDLRKIIEFLRSQGLITIGIIGHSRGAVEAIMYSWLYDDIDLIVSIAARYNLTSSIISKYLTPEQLKDLNSGEIEFAEILPRDNIPRKISLKCIEKRSEVDYKLLQNVHNTKYFLLIHGTKDEVVDPQDVNEIAKFIPTHIPHEIVMIEDGTHALSETPEVRSIVNLHINRVISSFLEKSRFN
ncbi:uncharacterized protein CMU_035800 [Cryptosporidium muris RN66]|uniref:Serine aminopeptidase S33 domain-containing protein n=1 Tax=Cryptosporidium muris (strain RN66) TaxID=441375 RepID=B6AGR6_CRYMR|nr:uncharacterized protein CMU_035800 [Cryptosporidium muris RN66]EEA07407.1 hypothetical protein, conserved [Cryptosporidium muris RN66]|eukprot:XP_002141756.1 hypothetical protein [Cryptosporidium muris RN66]